MKKSIYLFVLMLLASIVSAQTPPAQPTPPTQTTAPSSTSGKTLPELLNWMTGEWEGEGTSRGENPFIGKLSVVPELDSTSLLIHRESTTKDGMTGGLKELIIIGYDSRTKKIAATLYDNKNSIDIYVGESKANEIVFSCASCPQGYVWRFSFKQMPDGGVQFVKERSEPGKEPSKVAEINFKKKS
jgi:hypothetical protein